MKDIKLPEINRELVIGNHRLWGAIEDLAVLKLRGISEDKHKVAQEIDSILQDYATEAVKLNTPEQPDTKKPEKELIPFDLEAAKRGDPIITRDGRKARFIAYVPEAIEGHKLIAFVEGGSLTISSRSCGSAIKGFESKDDLFMAPKPMKTVYVNFHKNGECFVYQFRSSANTAAANAMGRNPTIATAIPVKIPA